MFLEASREAVGKVAAQIFSASGVKGMPPNLPSTTYHTHTEFDYLPLEYAANLIMQERSAHMQHGGTPPAPMQHAPPQSQQTPAQAQVALMLQQLVAASGVPLDPGVLGQLAALANPAAAAPATSAAAPAYGGGQQGYPMHQQQQGYSQPPPQQQQGYAQPPPPAQQSYAKPPPPTAGYRPGGQLGLGAGVMGMMQQQQAQQQQPGASGVAGMNVSDILAQFSAYGKK